MAVRSGVCLLRGGPGRRIGLLLLILLPAGCPELAWDDDQSCRCGSCVDLRTDPEHCGQCGNRCEFPAALSECRAGRCVIRTCTAGFLDRDLLVANGCECPSSSACSPGSLRCGSGLVVEICAPDGCHWQVAEQCACGCNAGQCMWLCQPGERQCRANQELEECAPNGCGWQPAGICRCACRAGACVPPCEPDAGGCDNGDAVRCGNDGCSWQVVEQCVCGCTHDRCDAPQCDPFARRCNGTNQVEACAADGCRWAAVQDCGADGCVDHQCVGACEATIYWQPSSMSASATTSGITLRAEFRQRNGGPELELRICGPGNFQNPLQVYFEEQVRYNGRELFDATLNGVGSPCTPWGELDDLRAWQVGDGLGGQLRIISPALCVDEWEVEGRWCNDPPEPGCGFCWHINTGIMRRTCLKRPTD